jgi:glycosyltransferase involved in cell wall biosynthesis
MQHTPRVVYLTDSLADLRMIEGFAQQFDLTVLAPEGAAVTTWPTERPPRSASLRGGRLFTVRAANWLVANRHAFDIVVVQDNLRAALAANVARIITRRPVVIFQGRPTEEYFRCRRTAGLLRGWRYLLGLAAVRLVVWFNERAASAVCAVSEYVAAQCRRHNAGVSVVSAYGVDLDVYVPGSRAQAREQLGLAGRGDLVLFRSRIAHEKDPVTFLRAMARLRADGRDVLALYVGGEHAAFADLARREGVPVIARNHVHPTRELPLFYRAASLTVQTSLAEGLGMSPLESLACEVPVVVSAVGGLVEVADHGRTGALVGSRDVEGTARAIAWVLDHPDAALAMAKDGRNMVLGQYGSNWVFSRWDQIVRDLIATARRRAPVAEGEVSEAA